VDATDSTLPELKMLYDCIDGKKTFYILKITLHDWSSVAKFRSLIKKTDFT